MKGYISEQNNSNDKILHTLLSNSMQQRKTYMQRHKRVEVNDDLEI